MCTGLGMAEKNVYADVGVDQKPAWCIALPSACVVQTLLHCQPVWV
jgi:hypothetical protein